MKAGDVHRLKSERADWFASGNGVADAVHFAGIRILTFEMEGHMTFHLRSSVA
jgi:hypothetical protein